MSLSNPHLNSRAPYLQALSSSFWDLTGFDLDLVECDKEGVRTCFQCVRNDSCRRHLQSAKGKNACKEFLAQMCREAQKDGRLSYGICHAGFQNVVSLYHRKGKKDYFLVVGRQKQAGTETLEAAKNLLEVLKLEIADRLCHTAGSDERSLSSPVRRAREFLETHYDEPIRLNDLASLSGSSPYHLSHTFSSEMGVPVSSYLKGLRIKHACRLLKDTRATISEICFEVGFQSLSQFNRAFRAETGLTPTAFRSGT